MLNLPLKCTTYYIILIIYGKKIIENVELSLVQLLNCILIDIIMTNISLHRSLRNTLCSAYSPELSLTLIALWKVWTQESFHKLVEYDRPGDRSPEQDC